MMFDLLQSHRPSLCSTTIGAITTLVVTLVAGGAIAETAVPLGPPTFLSPGNIDHQDHPAIVLTATGGLVVWDQFDGIPELGLTERIRARALDIDGVPVGDRITISINDEPASKDEAPDVILLADGRVLIAWRRERPTPPFTRLFARTLDAGGVGPVTRLDSGQLLFWNPGPPSLATNGDGGFLVSWHTNACFQTILYQCSGVFARGFGPNLGALGRSFLVRGVRGPSPTTGQHKPHLAARPNGDYVMVEAGGGYIGLPDNVYVRGVRPNGRGAGRLQSLASGNPGELEAAQVGVAPNGDTLVVWEDDGSVGDADSVVWLARIDEQGAAIGAPILVDDLGPGEAARAPRIALVAADRFIVTYLVNFAVPSRGRVFTTDGQPTGEPFPIEVLAEAVASRGDGVLVVVGGISQRLDIQSFVFTD